MAIILFNLLISLNVYASATPICILPKTDKLPIVMQIDESIPDSVRDEAIKIIIEAANRWNSISNRKLIEINTDPFTYNIGKSVNDIKWLDDWSIHPEEWEAVTLIHREDGKIIFRSIEINQEKYIFKYRDHQNIWDVDFLSLMIHELGHSLGAYHSKNQKDIMYPILDLYTIKQTITDADKINICKSLKRFIL